MPFADHGREIMTVIDDARCFALLVCELLIHWRHDAAKVVYDRVAPFSDVASDIALPEVVRVSDAVSLFVTWFKH